MADYDAIVFVSFGGPEGPDDVIPFLENVTRGRGIPRERLAVVGEHYHLFGGKSPINEQNRTLIAALEDELGTAGIDLPVYFGNRNWHPMLDDTVEQMKKDGVKNALAFVTSAYSSYSGCRQYRENIAAACEKAGDGAPKIDKIRAFWNHPGFIEPMIDNTKRALAEIPADRRDAARLVFTAHSIPTSMADTSDYDTQLADAAALIAKGAGRGDYDRVYQSRSGPPTQPWLEPDVVDHIEALHNGGATDVVLVPIGFISDHMEVVYDLDTQAREKADEIGLNLIRAATVGTDPRFVTMIRTLIEERLHDAAERPALGNLGPRADVCAPDCCPAPKRPPARPAGAGGGRPAS